MAWHRYGTFTGGLDLPENTGRTLNEPIEPLFVPPYLLVPLALPGSPSAELLIEPGKTVRAGQVLARGDGKMIPDVLAPLSGRTAELTTAQVAVGGRFVPVEAMRINSLQADPPPDHPPLAKPWRQTTPDDLLAFAIDSKLTTFRQPIMGLGEWLTQNRAAHTQTLVLSALENQPYLTANHRLLVESGPLILTGLAILARALGATQVILAVDQRRSKAYSHLVVPANELGVELIGLPHKYPLGADPILLKVITGREIPQGRTSHDIHAAVIDPMTTLAVARGFTTGQPTLWRVVTLDGPQARNARNLTVPLGTPCQTLFDLPGIELIHGGPMTGLPCKPDAIVTSTTRAVLALARESHASPHACLRCGWCTDLCPTRLNVSNINDAFELADFALAQQAGAMACVHCGVCSYICPSRLPLTHRVGEMKHLLSQGRSLATPPDAGDTP
jgi:Na+-translocating ferredoxin:NAD+ oxidoreductase subunit C